MYTYSLRILVALALMLGLTNVHAERCAAGGRCSDIQSTTPKVKPVIASPDSRPIIIPKRLPQRPSQLTKSYAANNVFIVDSEKKFCFGVNSNSQYLEVFPFNMASYNASKCQAWDIKLEKPDKQGYVLSAGKTYLNIVGKGKLIIRSSHRLSSIYWNVDSAGEDDNLIIKNINSGSLRNMLLGITSGGQISFYKGINPVKFVSGRPPAINETYEYKRNIRGVYAISVKPVTVVTTKGGSSGVSKGGSQPPVNNGSDVSVPGNVGIIQPSINDTAPRIRSQAERLTEADKAHDAGAYGESFRMYEALAHEGMMDAQYYLGNAYEMGQGTLVDYHQAFDWYKRAADRGDAESHLRIAYLYYYGYGVEQNYNTAADWARHAHEILDSNPDRTVLLHLNYFYAKMYEYGHGESKNLSKALELYKYVFSRDRGNKYNAGNDMGRIRAKLRHAKSRNKDIDLANAGDGGAAMRVGGNYLSRRDNHGRVSRENHSEAVKWFSKSAEMGNPLAWLEMSVEYASGEILAKDLDKSEEWMNKTEQWVRMVTSGHNTESITFQPWMINSWEKFDGGKNAYFNHVERYMYDTQRHIKGLLAKDH